MKLGALLVQGGDDRSEQFQGKLMVFGESRGAREFDLHARLELTW